MQPVYRSGRQTAKKLLFDQYQAAGTTQIPIQLRARDRSARPARQREAFESPGIGLRDTEHVAPSLTVGDPILRG